MYNQPPPIQNNENNGPPQENNNNLNLKNDNKNLYINQPSNLNE